jgi:ubiquinone/menaquinone biosynthesis C-methylase UbiE
VTSNNQEEASRRWGPTGKGAWYDKQRWNNSRRRERDPRIVREILSQYAPQNSRILDAPCGTGRLAAAISKHGCFVGLDSSASMLAEAHDKSAGALFRANVNQMPFEGNSFDAVLCCRLLHHLKTRQELERTLGELLRVSRGLVAGSFWDARSLAALKRRLPFVRKPAHRGPFPKQWIAECVQAAGGEVIAWKHSARFFSQQTWFVAQKT